MDERLDGLKRWLADDLHMAGCELRPASADASFRRYFRVHHDDRTLIAMDAPADKEDTRPYVDIAGRLLGLGLNAPRVLEADPEKGYLLLSDLGTRLYLDHLNEATVERMYGDAIGAMIILQAGTFSAGDVLPPYDEALLRREMELFRDWYLGRHLGIHLSPEQDIDLEEGFALLVGAALEQPRVWVHRDFHSRNLMLTERNNPGILDFQDAVLGPVTYDLVSLLRDCYIAWPRDRVENWAKNYFAVAAQSGIPAGADEDQFLWWFDRMGIQRHLKAIGIFARLNHRDGKPGYLRDIPRVLQYVVDTCGHCDDLKNLAHLLHRLDLTDTSA